jgi:hypothetical protein
MQFLIARHKNVVPIDKLRVRIGKSLIIDTGNHFAVIIQAGEQKEVRLSVPFENDPTEVKLTYTWDKEGK